MTKKNFGLAAAIVLVLALAGTAFAAAVPQGQRPPEYNELVAASRLQDPAARLKEFERIKTAFPSSQYMATIDIFILNAKIELAPSIEAILELQKGFPIPGRGAGHLTGHLQIAAHFLDHPKVKAFDAAKILAIVLQHKAAAVKAADDPATYEAMKDPAEQKNFKEFFLKRFDLIVIQARLNAGQASQALAELDAYKAASGPATDQYYALRGQACESLGRTKEAYEAYLGGAVEGDEASVPKAKALYQKLNGKVDGFEAALKAAQKALPYHPEPFKPAASWSGKAVLAEIFTGSECPPCVGADLGFDGLIESYPAKYLAVLEYHLPIPAPDPMMNPATQKRQAFYGVNSTPTVFIDGDQKLGGGGSRGMAEGKYKQYKTEIDARVNAAPGLKLKVQASLSGDTVKAACDFDKVVAGAEYLVVLVQEKEDYAGSNGIAEHKMVVRDLVALQPSATKQASFDLAASEKAADAHLTELEKTWTRTANFKFKERRARIGRTGLKVVFFVQETESKKVLNAVVADVK